MFDDHSGRLIELGHYLLGGLYIGVVVEGEFLAVQLLPGRTGSGRQVEFCGLVGILSVAQPLMQVRPNLKDGGWVTAGAI